MDSSNASSPVVASPSLGSVAIARLRDLALVPALLLLVIIGSVVSPCFLTQANIITILTSSAALAMVVLAESLVIITGKFDLSLESTFGFAPAIGALSVLPAASFGFGFELPTVLGILLLLAVGAIIGFLNGLMVVKLKLNAFIVTLAMLIIVRGMLVGATSGRTLFDLPEAFCGCAVRSRYRDSAAAEEARLDRGEPPLQRFGQAAVDRSLPLPGDAEHQQPSPRAFRRRCTPGLRSSWRCGST